MHHTADECFTYAAAQSTFPVWYECGRMCKWRLFSTVIKFQVCLCSAWYFSKDWQQASGVWCVLNSVYTFELAIRLCACSVPLPLVYSPLLILSLKTISLTCIRPWMLLALRKSLHQVTVKQRGQERCSPWWCTLSGSTALRVAHLIPGWHPESMLSGDGRWWWMRGADGGECWSRWRKERTAAVSHGLDWRCDRLQPREGTSTVAERSIMYPVMREETDGKMAYSH